MRGAAGAFAALVLVAGAASAVQLSTTAATSTVTTATRLADARACNPRVRVCEREAGDVAEPRPATRRGARERRFLLRGASACNPRVKLCEKG